MFNEYEALIRNETWVLVPPDQATNFVGCKWVFRVKRNADGPISVYKGMLVAKGFNQRAGIDFKETLNPVIKPAMVNKLISLTVSFGWDITQLDVSNASLNGTFDETLYMTQPPNLLTSPSLAMFAY